jgi:hypothetical protein
MELIEEPYKMRGRRVPAMTRKRIHTLAVSFLQLIGISFLNRHSLIEKIEHLDGNERFPLVISPINDAQWEKHYCGIAEGFFESSLLRIYLPDSTYEKAYQWDLKAVHTFLHEVGHCFLAHGKYLNYDADGVPQESEDAEFQADCFAEEILRILKIKKDDRQMTLF